MMSEHTAEIQVGLRLLESPGVGVVTGFCQTKDSNLLSEDPHFPHLHLQPVFFVYISSQMCVMRAWPPSACVYMYM